MFQLAAAPPPIVKPGCRDRCGDISIPYPFGIGKDCYKNEWFAIECNETVSPATAFISAIFNMEVLNISAERATATVKGPIISSNCTGTKNGVPLDLSGTPFVFSFDNVFVAVGCNTEALMSGAEQTLVGCVSPCSDVESKNFCQANPSSLLQVFNLKLEATDDRKGCKLAFLVNETWFESNISDPLTVQHRDYVPAVLGWMMDYNIYDQSVACRGFQNESFGYECICIGGYEGIPYRELGCKDVDECKEESKHSCRGLLKCVNTPGSFKCEINKLYIALIVIGAVVLALSLLMGIWGFYKLLKKRKNIELKKKFFKRNGGLLLQQELRAADDNRLTDILDARVKELCQNEEVILVANLAKRCLNLNGKIRPTMREVASELERIIGLSQKELSIQESCKISKNIMDVASNDWDASKNIMDDAVSTPITGDFDTSRTPSSDGEQPFINTTKC
ncbi:hypothetical protein OIU77_022471 [Salix suchowensis]|uniref:Uncharacterized protein n=1 Tax=Salix suchowensis TaxID=1278906 RepID=A0ABQ9C250_9ROSI|nr:hypothetical protein OIU77_022471 [Salix suchowensis]